MYLLPDTLANHLALLDIEKEQMTLDTSGHGLKKLLANYDPLTSYWKTSKATLPLDSPKSLLTLPKSGSMQSGQLFDVGATHRRARLYVLAYPNDRKRERVWEMPKLGIGYNSRANLQMQEGRFNSVIDRWETVLDRSYPPPLEDGKLNPVFVEWMMGLPEGWVTGHGIPRSSELKLLGNGVVPQQAKAAIQIMLYNMSRESR
jgi:hypothetical protein